MSGMIDLGRGSLVDRAVEAVRDYIRAHDLKVGDTLPGEGVLRPSSVSAAR